VTHLKTTHLYFFQKFAASNIHASTQEDSIIIVMANDYNSDYQWCARGISVTSSHLLESQHH